ncbi:MAG: hypothetical protein H7269_11430 [Cellulomonas sp.]|nr:hypothetical protein [Cellulomonas sp.]
MGVSADLAVQNLLLLHLELGIAEHAQRLQRTERLQLGELGLHRGGWRLRLVPLGRSVLVLVGPTARLAP